MSKKSKREEVRVEIIDQQEPEIQEQNHPVEENTYPKEMLAKSKALSHFGLHPDVIRAILIKDSYTISEAQSAIQKYIDSF